MRSLQSKLQLRQRFFQQDAIRHGETRNICLLHLSCDRDGNRVGWTVNLNGIEEDVLIRAGNCNHVSQEHVNKANRILSWVWGGEWLK